MSDFAPSNKKQSIIDLSHFNLSNYANYYSNAFFEKIKHYSFKELTAIRNSDLEIELKEKIQEFLKIKNKTSNRNIVFGFGSYSILERLAWKFLKKGLMIGEFPQFHFFPMEYILAGGRYKGFWNKNFTFPKEEILNAVKENKNLKAIYINNPNNPSGKLFDTKAIIEVIKNAEKKRIIVIVDEAYGDFLDVKYSLASFVNQFSNLIVLRSFSKCFGLQNLRLGYMISNEKIISKYLDVCAWNEINNFGAIAGLTVLGNRNYLQRLKKQSLILKKKTVLFLKKKFNVVSSHPSVPLIFFRAEKNIDFEEYFRKMNIAVMGSKDYQVVEKTFPQNYARIRIPVAKKDLKAFKERLEL